jgi:hypothetical protein
MIALLLALLFSAGCHACAGGNCPGERLNAPPPLEQEWKCVAESTGPVCTNSITGEKKVLR